MENLFSFFESPQLIGFFIKAFSITFSAIFLLYAVVFYKQAKVMTQTLHTRRGALIVGMALVQIIAAIILLITAFVIM